MLIIINIYGVNTFIKSITKTQLYLIIIMIAIIIGITFFNLLFIDNTEFKWLKGFDNILIIIISILFNNIIIIIGLITFLLISYNIVDKNLLLIHWILILINNIYLTNNINNNIINLIFVIIFIDIISIINILFIKQGDNIWYYFLYQFLYKYLFTYTWFYNSVFLFY